MLASVVSDEHMNSIEEIAMSGKSYHGNPDRDNNFWVYPRDQQLEVPEWDTYNADDLCNNYTFLGTSG
ncbi:unnamed protein product [Rotaria sp. Silwood2]|nr:unnamed protein product [Rotaria sp. Silwood2]CAF4119512.1 unnamed protein product [Rotaria sp. Silwood2]